MFLLFIEIIWETSVWFCATVALAWSLSTWTSNYDSSFSEISQGGVSDMIPSHFYEFSAAVTFYECYISTCFTDASSSYLVSKGGEAEMLF